MLTAQERTDLRTRAHRSQRRQVRVWLAGGPLDGAEIAVTEDEAPELFLGFCGPTRRRPVHAL